MEIKLKVLKCSVTDCTGRAAAQTGAGFSTEATDSIRKWSTWDFWWAKWYWDKLFSESMSLTVLLIIPSILHSYLSSGLGQLVHFIQQCQRAQLTPFLQMRIKRMGLENK
jgi:hypothetical protein